MLIFVILFYFPITAITSTCKLCCLFFYLTKTESLESDFVSGCPLLSKILKYVFLGGFFAGKDQAHSADSDGERTESAANFGGRESDPAAPLIKQSIPGYLEPPSP